MKSESDLSSCAAEDETPVSLSRPAPTKHPLREVSLGHYGGKGRFSALVNSRAVFVDYHAYMTLDAQYLDVVDPKMWDLLCRAIAASDYCTGDDHDDLSKIFGYAETASGEIISFHVKWDPTDGDKGKDISAIYHNLLDMARQSRNRRRDG